MADPSQIIISQVITEKTSGLRMQDVYTFKVLLAAKKTQIKNAVEKLFNVDVVAVNTSKVRGKKRVLGKSIGKTSQWKKAYVRLKEGQKIKMLEEAK